MDNVKLIDITVHLNLGKLKVIPLISELVGQTGDTPGVY